MISLIKKIIGIFLPKKGNNKNKSNTGINIVIGQNKQTNINNNTGTLAIGDNTTIIKNPVRFEGSTLIFGESIILSEYEQKVLSEFACGAYGVYALNEDGKIEQINIVDGPQEISAYDIDAINSYRKLIQHGFLSKNTSNETITITNSGRYHINTLNP